MPQTLLPTIIWSVPHDTASDNHNRLTAALDNIFKTTKKNSKIVLTHRSVVVLELPQFRDTAFDVVLLLHIDDAVMWLELNGSEQPFSLPAGVIVWGESALLDASTILKWFHYNASDVIVMDDTDLPVDQALQEAMVRARRQRTLLQMSTSLFKESKKIQARADSLMQDQTAGQKLQLGLLPEDIHQRGPLTLESFVSPALVLSGDFIDHFKIGEHCVGFYLADVAGHGVSAAIITVLLKSYMSRYLMLSKLDKNQGIREPAKVMAKLNNSILESGIDKHLTMIYGVIDYKANTIEYVNAGHFPYPALWDGKVWTQLNAASKPIGLFEDTEFASHKIDLPDEFALLLSSDGLLEVFSDGTNDERMVDFQQQYIKLVQEGYTLAEIVAQLEVDRKNKSDDISILTIQK